MMSPPPPPMRTPSPLLATALFPAAFVPMKLPWTKLSSAVAPLIRTPSVTFPEITFRAPAVVPPIVLWNAEPLRKTPALPFPSAALPATLVPR